MNNEVNDLNWWQKLFRRKAKLTYWLNTQVYVIEVCDFTEKTPECIVFKDYYTKKAVMVKHNVPITYVLEETK
jgi:hypothetical protein